MYVEARTVTLLLPLPGILCVCVC